MQQKKGKKNRIFIQNGLTNQLPWWQQVTAFYNARIVERIVKRQCLLDLI